MSEPSAAARPGLKAVVAPDADRWNAACDASGQPVTAFHSYGWLCLAATMTRTSFLPLIITGKGGDLGVAPLLVRRRLGASVVNWSPFPYLGPLVPVDLLAACLRLLQHRQLRLLALRQQQSFPPGASVSVQALADNGFAVREDSTYVIDTRAAEGQLWLKLDSGCRRRIRKAQRDGVEIVPAVDGSALGRVVEDAFSSHGLKSGYSGTFPPGPEAFENSNLNVRYVVATQHGTVVGSLCSFAYRRAALIWQGGVLPKHRDTNASCLLYWDAISWAHDAAANSLDLVGLPNAGIQRFKSQFGGSPETYVVAHRDLPLLRLTRPPAAGRDWARIGIRDARQLEHSRATASVGVGAE